MGLQYINIQKFCIAQFLNEPKMLLCFERQSKSKVTTQENGGSKFLQNSQQIKAGIIQSMICFSKYQQHNYHDVAINDILRVIVL